MVLITIFVGTLDTLHSFRKSLVFGLLDNEMNIPKDYEQLFGAGTKPADWEEMPSSFSEIGEILTEQKRE